MENPNLSYFRKSDNFTFDTYRPLIHSDNQDNNWDENNNQLNSQALYNRVNRNNLNTDDYDITVSFDNDESDIKINDDFASEFLEKLENIIKDGYEF